MMTVVTSLSSNLWQVPCRNRHRCRFRDEKFRGSADLQSERPRLVVAHRAFTANSICYFEYLCQLLHLDDEMGNAREITSDDIVLR